MPHSSGGGSHRSGAEHHSGSAHTSYHSGGSSSGYSHGQTHYHAPPPPPQPPQHRRLRRHFFPGAYRYVYYSGCRPRYVYSNYPLVSSTSIPRRTCVILMGVAIAMILAAFGLMRLSTLGTPVKPIRPASDTEIHVIDNIGVLNDTDGLMRELEAFRRKTGVTPAIMTVHNESWQTHYSSLEEYAYEAYVNLFEDEKHWLIVYSEPERADPTYNDWFWEGMQGDDTDGILTPEKTERFNRLMQRNFMASMRYTIAQAFEKTFSDYNEIALERDNIGYTDRYDNIVVPLCVISVAMFAVASYYLLFPGRQYTYVPTASGETADAEPDTVQCDYCGGTFVSGVHENCPHCGAPL